MISPISVEIRAEKMIFNEKKLKIAPKRTRFSVNYIFFVCFLKLHPKKWSRIYFYFVSLLTENRQYLPISFLGHTIFTLLILLSILLLPNHETKNQMVHCLFDGNGLPTGLCRGAYRQVLPVQCFQQGVPQSFTQQRQR